MLYSELSYTAQKNAELNILGICGSEKELAELIASDYFLFDIDGEIIEEQDNY